MEKLKSKISIEDCDKTMDLPKLRDFMKTKRLFLLGLLSYFFLYALRTNPFDKNACWATRWFEAAR
jgi:hypothetical protein